MSRQVGSCLAVVGSEVTPFIGTRLADPVGDRLAVEVDEGYFGARGHRFHSSPVESCVGTGIRLDYVCGRTIHTSIPRTPKMGQPESPSPAAPTNVRFAVLAAACSLAVLT